MSERDLKYSVFLRHLLEEQGKLFGYIFALVPNLSVVDDLMQETIMVMWEKFDTFEPGTNFYAWAKKVAYYKVSNYLDRAYHSEVHFSQEVLESIEQQSDVFENADLRITALEQCLKKLKEADKQLIKFKYVEGLSIKDVALKANRSVDGMYKVMSRIHCMLENCIRRTLILLEKSS